MVNTAQIMYCIENVQSYWTMIIITPLDDGNKESLLAELYNEEHCERAKVEWIKTIPHVLRLDSN